MIRIAVLGAPVARPLDFAEAFLASGVVEKRSEMLEEGPFRALVVEARDAQDRDVELTVVVAPRSGGAQAFTAALSRCDAAIVLAGVGGRDEQEAALEAIARGLRDRPVPWVLAVNEFVPPRLQADTAPVAVDAPPPLRIVRGRLCWWRHEKSGLDVVRDAIAACCD